MGAAYFYHLTTQSLEQALPMLLGKARGAGWRVEVRSTDRAKLEALDAALWMGPEEGFLPHGLSGGPHDADQPILLCDTPQQGFACIMSVHGADLSAEDVTAAERCCILFDGHDGAALDHARGQWKALTGAGCAAQYWSQESGRWEMKAESGGAA